MSTIKPSRFYIIEITQHENINLWSPRIANQATLGAVCFGGLATMYDGNSVLDACKAADADLEKDLAKEAIEGMAF